MSQSGNHSASSSEATRKREEKMKVIQQRLKDEQERRESALREHQEKLERVNAVKEAERRERARQIRERELSRQRAVFDRRKVQEDVDRHKRESLLNKYKVYEERASHLNKQKPTYAFGSSTPRVLGYLEHLERDQKIYDTKLIASPLTPAEVEALKTTSRSSLDNGRPHRSHTPSSTLRVAFGSTIRDETPKRKKDSTEQPMSGVGSPQSGRSSRSLTRTAAATRVRATANPMTQSVHVVARTAANVANTANATASPPIAPRRAPKTSHATRFSSNGPNRAMTQSFTVGDGSNTSRALTRKAALPAESRLHSTGRSSSTRALSASAHKENAAPAPTTRRPVAANGHTNTDNGPHKRPTPSRTASAAARKPPTPTTSAASAAPNNNNAINAINNRRRLNIHRYIEHFHTTIEALVSQCRTEEEFRRQEEEEMRVLEEMRREEQERLERAIEEERLRRELEQQEAAKEAERKRLEEEAGKLERDRLEQEKQERQLKLQKEQEERDERKARLSAIMNRTRAAGASPASAPGSSPALSLLPGAVMSESTTLTAESPTGPSPTPFKSPILSGLLGSLNASNASNNAAVSPSAAPAPALSSNTTRALQKLATMSGNPRLNTMVNKHGSNPSLADELSAALGDQQPPHPDSNGNSPPPARMAMSMSAADWISSLPSTSPDSDAMAVGVAGMRVRGGSHGDESDLERVSFDVNQNESQDSLHVADSVSKRALDELGDGDDFDVAVMSPALQNGHASSSQSSTAEDLIKI
uniref:Ensconsin n=1 Tax=Plectus sambesii TaxID=2011161 RepID=A0A914UTC1_9BILA